MPHLLCILSPAELPILPGGETPPTGSAVDHGCPS